ncbi:uncharacterized protein LOC135346346 [Halichondria panicea]|uniref:uncharacterized protein LOC135346346 n=1 Tax=Halichondria panicea TaxID=6063 RepID=UPI00312B6424
MSVTPESTRTISLTSQENNGGIAPGPTPKNEFKRPPPKSTFMSPTDVMVSPCTEKLMQSRRLPHRPWLKNSRPKLPFQSKLADKENVHKAPEKQ